MLRPNRVPSNAVRPAKQLGGGCAVLFGLPFLLGGLAIGWFLYLPGISAWWAAQRWEEVPCWIESANLDSSQGKDSTTYKATARYRYDYQGRTYHSEEVSLNSGSDNIGDFQQTAYEQLRQFDHTDRPFRCFVNPAKPQQAVLFRELRWGLMLLMSLFPMLFPLVGGLVSIGGGWGARKATIGKKLAQQHPGEPWRWREEWSGDAIQASKNGFAFIGLVAGWILLIQGPLAAAIVVSGELSRSILSALALLPSLLALIPLSFAWKRMKTRMALGHPSLRLKQTPIRPGFTLEGDLCFDRVLSPREILQVKMLCQRQITRSSGDSNTTTKETIWEHTETLSASEARRDQNGVTVPLRVQIPRGLPCSVVEDAAFVIGDEQSHVWTLELASSSGGKPAVLPLPVFVTGDEAQLAESDTQYEIEVIAPDTEQLTERLKQRGVTMEFDVDGIPTLIDCPPGRFRGPALFLLFFGTIWSVVFVVLMTQGAPLLFRLIWGITSPLILGLGLWTLLHRRRVQISPEELLIINSVSSLYSRRDTYAPRHIVAFTHDSNMQSGNQFYYRVRAETTFGKKETLIDGITESVTAETLARRLEDWRKK